MNTKPSPEANKVLSLIAIKAHYNFEICNCHCTYLLNGHFMDNYYTKSNIFLHILCTV